MSQGWTGGYQARLLQVHHPVLQDAQLAGCQRARASPVSEQEEEEEVARPSMVAEGEGQGGRHPALALALRRAHL